MTVVFAAALFAAALLQVSRRPLALPVRVAKRAP